MGIQTHSDNRVLNLFRSVAALAVVLGHVRLLFFEDYSTANHDGVTALLYSLTSLGSEAVIVFFVMSGYWVGGSVIGRFRSSAFRWGDYANARLTRLWLVLIPALLLTLILDKVGGSAFPDSDVYANPQIYAGVPAAPSYSPLTFIGNLLFLQDIHLPVFGSNQPLWSLAYEAWYYLLFPALLAAFWHGGSRRRKLIGGLLAVIAILVSGPAVIGLFPAWLVGALVAGLKKPISEIFARVSTFAVAAIRLTAIVVIVGTAVFVHEVDFPFGLDPLLLGVVTALGMCPFVTDVQWSGRPGRVLDALSWTAHSSYSLYAIHMPIIVFAAAALVPARSDRWTISPGPVALYVLIIAGCCLLAYVFARFTERKTGSVRRWAASITTRAKARAGASSAP